MAKPKHHIFICASTRLNGKVQGVCEKKSSHNLIQTFNEAIFENDMDKEVMITGTGCMGLCDKGPVVMIYPEQTWYGNVTDDDVDDILEALENGETIDRLLI